MSRRPPETGSIFARLSRDSGRESFPFLSDDLFTQIKEVKEHTSIFCYHTEENFKYVVSHWNKLVELGRHFSLYFVSPSSKGDQKWVIFPFTHHQIAEGENIEMGLTSIAERVPYITKKEIEKLD